MLWGQPSIKVFTDHKNLMRDGLGLTSDQVYQWRLLLEEYGQRLSVPRAYTTPLQMQSHGISMTPVSSVNQLHDKSYQVLENQETKLDGSLKTLV
jgi:hypothetical protein